MPLFLGTALVVVGAVLLGGSAGIGRWSDGVVQLTSLILFALLAFRGRFATLSPAVVIILAAFVVLPLLQLIPLPPSVWTQLPGRDQFADTYEQFGLPLQWAPLSLNPQASWLAILGLLPAISVFLATVSLDNRARRSLSVIFIALGLASVLLGLAQLMEGPDSTLRIYYPSTNTFSSVGFFANRNHHGAFLYSLVPLIAAWTAGFLFDRRPERYYGLVVCLLVYVALILGFGMAGSRAALFLGVGATAASLLLAASNNRRFAQRNFGVIAGATAIGLILIIQFAFFTIVGRLDDAILDSDRLRVANTTMTAIHAFQPTGSGLGTFVDVYKIFELPADLRRQYANHAHNDWLELWLEGGWLFIGLAAAFLAWFGAAAWRVWREPPQEGRALDRALAQGGVIAMVLLLVHSLADYPLRTTTIMTLFAFCAALLIKPPPAAGREMVASGDETERLGRPRRRSQPASPTGRQSFRS